jgi:hypothetical protein
VTSCPQPPKLSPSPKHPHISCKTSEQNHPQRAAHYTPTHHHLAVPSPNTKIQLPVSISIINQNLVISTLPIYFLPKRRPPTPILLRVDSLCHGCEFSHIGHHNTLESSLCWRQWLFVEALKVHTGLRRRRWRKA